MIFMNKIYRILKNNIFLKTISCIVGFLFWNILSQNSINNLQLTADIKFYNNIDNIEIISLKTAEINIQIAKKNLKYLNKTDLAVYIDVNDLNYGDNIYYLTEQNIHLPKFAKIISYRPWHIAIKILKT